MIGGIAEMSAATGKVLRLFIPQHVQGNHVQGNAVYPCQLGPIDASGHHLLAGCTQFDRIDWGPVTPPGRQRHSSRLQRRLVNKAPAA